MLFIFLRIILCKIRFGPGLVIYWLGYIETLESRTAPGVFIRDHLPMQIAFMDPASTHLIPTTKEKRKIQPADMKPKIGIGETLTHDSL